MALVSSTCVKSCFKKEYHRTLNYSYYRILFIVTPSITLSNNPNIIHSTLPPDINTAEVTILTQNVILQANIEGKWEKSGELISATNTVTFELITLNIAGLYEFYTSESGVSTLTIRIQISVTGTLNYLCVCIHCTCLL